MNHSESLDNLAAALVKVQAELQPVPKDKVNPYFNSMYADLGTIIDASRPLLTKHGLAVTQLPGASRYTHMENDKDGRSLAYGVVSLTTVLLHDSGEFISLEAETPCRFGDPQKAMAARTYLRRGAMQAVVGIAAEEDDDGNAAAGSRKAPHASSKAAAAPQTGGDTQEYEGESSGGICAVHNIPFRHNVGIGRNDKPYDFWGCPHNDEVDGKRVYCKERPPKRDNKDEQSLAASAPAEDDKDPWAEEGEKPEKTADEWRRFVQTEFKARGIKTDERLKLFAEWAKDRKLAHVPADDAFNAALFADFWTWFTDKESK